MAISEAQGAGPRWINELARLSAVKPVIILHGNVRDMQYYWDDSGVQSARPTLVEALFDILPSQGYQRIYAWDLIDGIRVPPADDDESAARAEEQLDAVRDALASMNGSRRPRPAQGGSESAEALAEPNLLSSAVGERVTQQALEAMRILLRSDTPTACVVDFSSQLQTDAQRMTEDERMMWVRLLKAGADASLFSTMTEGGERRTCHNLLVIVCNKVNDLPTWLYYGNPDAAQVQLSKLETPERRLLFASSPVARLGDDVVDELSLATSDLSTTEIMALAEVVQREQRRAESAGATPPEPSDIVRSFKFGERLSPWDDPGLYQRVLNATDTLGKAVLNQDQAVQWMQDVLARAVLGTSGLQHSADRSKPRGVLFFAGHTGVGKTELAKATAELIFGKGAAPLRFDMSEYSTEFNAQRLIGAPPGYVGYDQGGQLTEAMKENPFRIILFDEIEKADPLVLDKFLQVLEDGRLTDGQGNTVYFSESIIIFTSNAGTRVFDESGALVVDPATGQPRWRIAPDTNEPYESVRTAFIEGVEDYFKNWLGRPELLNRIGLQNIIVFDVLRAENVEDIVDLVVQRTREGLLKEQRVRLELSVDAENAIAEGAKATLGQGMGGRGIANLVEIALINPMSRDLLRFFATNRRPVEGEELLYSIDRLFKREGGAIWDLELSAKPTYQPAREDL